MDLCSFESAGIVDDVVSQCGLVERLDRWLDSVHRARARAGVRENGQREFRQATQTPGQAGCCGPSDCRNSEGKGEEGEWGGRRRTLPSLVAENGGDGGEMDASSLWDGYYEKEREGARGSWEGKEMMLE
jgi:hypothetical protein